MEPSMAEKRDPRQVVTFVGLAVVPSLIELACNLAFLPFGFRACGIGIAIMLGWLVLFTAVLLYLIAVCRDLIRRGLL